MPQGRRKVPFSGKAKKLQLQIKRQSNAKGGFLLKAAAAEDDDHNCHKINIQPKHNPNRYALKFYKESETELKKLKETGRHGLVKRDYKDLELQDDYFKDLDFPKRPPWDYTMSVDDVQRNEQHYFTEYVNRLEKQHEGLSYFELNLETWRQLWRVLEMSDVILIITDIRYPLLMFPPYLYDYITKDLKKHMILVLNKIDLAPAPLVCAWFNYFKDKYPDLHILLFTSYPGYNVVKESTSVKSRKLKGRPQMSAEGAESLLKVCKSIVKDCVDLTSWEQKIIQEQSSSNDDDEDLEIEQETNINNDTSSYEMFKNGVLTIGCVGHPNVGKSSLMNALMGKKVVSVSKTPGHTKHFQTIFLTNNVKLCDCPGLVFPSAVPKCMQVLMGCYPISQLRETFSTIRFVAERLDLPKLLHLIHPDDDEEWSPFNICEAWAIKRGFLTARAARPDIHRAGINLLQLCLSGVICLKLTPPGFEDDKERWEHHEDLAEILRIQAKSKQDDNKDINFDDLSDDNEDLSKPKNEEHSDSEGSSDSEIPAMQNKFAALMN
uniref:Guanine nucleotide-binding protein-like 1 n=1 Tax=Xenopsylla cheopis TaxID=163159 RepID=A0A6M2DGQ7_XENCH